MTGEEAGSREGGRGEWEVGMMFGSVSSTACSWHDASNVLCNNLAGQPYFSRARRKTAKIRLACEATMLIQPPLH